MSWHYLQCRYLIHHGQKRHLAWLVKLVYPLIHSDLFQTSVGSLLAYVTTKLSQYVFHDSAKKLIEMKT